MQSLSDKFRVPNDEDIYERTAGRTINSKLMIIGCGGSGSWIAYSCALAGSREIVLIDNDIVELHNLNRTPYRLKDVGKPKVSALADIICGCRAGINVTPICSMATKELLEQLRWHNYHIIDCTDNYNTKRILFTEMPKTGQLYLKVGYDGNSYDIDSSNEYVFDLGQEGYRIRTTSVETTLMIASKIVSIIRMEDVCALGNVRILGDVFEELGGVSVGDEGNCNIQVMHRTTNPNEVEIMNEDDERLLAEGIRSSAEIDTSGDFEFEITKTNPCPEWKDEEAERLNEQVAGMIEGIELRMRDGEGFTEEQLDWIHGEIANGRVADLPEGVVENYFEQTGEEEDFTDSLLESEDDDDS